MLKAAVTVSKKKLNVPATHKGVFLTLFTASLGLVEKGKSNKQTNQKNSFKYPPTAAQLSEHKGGRWRRADGSWQWVYSVSLWQLLPSVQVGDNCSATRPTRGCGSGGWLGVVVCFGGGWATGVSSECRRLQPVPTARISSGYIFHLRTETSSQWLSYQRGCRSSECKTSSTCHQTWPRPWAPRLATEPARDAL